MTKTEFLNSAIEMMKKTGQGVPGFLRLKGLNSIIDELIAEGKLVSSWCRFNTLPDDEWLTVAGCYNVWTDKEPAALEFVRMYLGLEPSDLPGCSTRDIITDPELMERYAAWLKANKGDLEKMTSLELVKEVFVDPKTITFSEEEVSWVKTRAWYEDNEIVAECLKASRERGNDASSDDEEISLNKQLLKLYKTDTVKYKDKIAETEKEIQNIPRRQVTRTKLNQWLAVQNQGKTIQEVFTF